MAYGSFGAPMAGGPPLIASDEDEAQKQRRLLDATYADEPPTSASFPASAFQPAAPLPPPDDPNAPGYADRVAGLQNTAMVPEPLPAFTVTADGSVPVPMPGAPTEPATRTTVNKDVSSTTSRQVPTAGEAVAMGAAQNAMEQRQAANNEIGDVKTRVAEAAAGNAGDVEAQQAAKEAALVDLQKRRDDAYALGQAQEKRLYDEYKAKSTEEVLPDSLGTRILAAIVQGLGAYASSYNGGPNQAAQIIQAHTRETYQKHKDRIEQARQLYLDKHGMNAEADAHFDQLERNLNTRFAAGLDRLQAKGVALQLKAGVPLEKAQANAVNAQLAQESAQLKLENEKSLRKTVSNTTNTRTIKVTDTGDFGKSGKGPNGGKPIEARDENGKVLGYLSTPREHALFEKQDAGYNKAVGALRALADDIKQNGYAMSPNARTRRDRLHANAVLAVAAVTTAPSSDKSTGKEEATLGNPNPWLSKDATIAAIEDKLKEVVEHRDRVRREMLTPLPGMAEGATDGRGRAPAPGAAPAQDFSQDIEWLKTKGKLPENRDSAVKLMTLLKQHGAIQ